MPTFVKSHMRRGKAVRGYNRTSATSLMKKLKSSAIGSKQYMTIGGHLMSRAQRRLNKEADKRHSGWAGTVQGIPHAMSVLRENKLGARRKKSVGFGYRD